MPQSVLCAYITVVQRKFDLNMVVRLFTDYRNKTPPLSTKKWKEAEGV
jgi:hypothetical protein